ncbi:hypothetical protein H6P81_012786 [Aristolochia fimbriata]|uniref:FAD-binding domain-containing protein n=1 Tax=Aristolochia fimbriata TaxID=158543 RepID=A0AAV7EHF6_ARIFI|nr:hypothetical protein H6P81_012786 [Aristolochia fimbriata]
MKMALSKFLRTWRGFSTRRLPLNILCVSPIRSYSSFEKNGGDEAILPVLIVGAGPVGLLLSILLTKLGIKCAVLEKNASFSQHPQAHFINNRSMEIFCKVDGLAEEIQRLQPPVDLWRKFVYCTSLTGPILGSVDHMQPQDFRQIHSPVSVAHFSQYKLHQLLLKLLKDLDFNVCKSDELDNPELGWERKILMGHECLSIEPSSDNVTVGVSILKDGQKITRNIKCSILVGSDGAGSTLRKLMGISMTGEKDLQKLISIHFFSRDLGKYLCCQRPGMLFFIFNSEAIGVLVAHDLKQGEFVLQIPFYPPQQKIEDFSSEVCKEIILKLVGQKLEDVCVKDVKPWVMHAEVAERFVSCGNRVILIGDAAHRFPPAGGFGMNTGIQDAHNLAWKIACAFNGVTSTSIIQTYEMERKPIAHFNTELSVNNFKAAMSVPAALGLDPTVANAVHRVINGAVASVLPSGLQKALLEGIFTVGRAQLLQPILSEKNPLGSSRLSKLRTILDEGKSLQLQFPAEDLGFRYLEGALVLDSASRKANAIPAPTGRRKDYVPSSEPGARLPHMNVRMLNIPPDKATVSTLDLVNGGVLEFLLIIAPAAEAYNLARVSSEVAQRFKVSLKVCVMWPPGSFTGFTDGSKDSLHPCTNFIDVEEVRRSGTWSSWWEMCEMTQKGAILVRPDDHIAWRVKSEVIGDPVMEMERVFSLVLQKKLD